MITTLLFFFILGLIFGSFLSVIFSRLEIVDGSPTRKSKRHKKTDWEAIVTGRSRCDHCKKQIPWYDNVPLVSFILLRGQCRHCGKRISHYHPVLELITGLFFVAAYAYYGLTWQLGLALIMGLAMLFIFAYDLRHQLIPDIIVLPMIGLAAVVVLYSYAAVPLGAPSIGLLGEGTPVAHAIGGAVLGGFFLVLSLVSRGRWIGGGDLKLGLLIGLLLGWRFGLVALVLAYLVGTAYAIVLLLTKEASMKSSVPFAPMLVTGYLVAVFYGESIIQWYQGWFL